MKTPDENKCGLECIRTNVERVCVKPPKGQCPRCEQLVGESLALIQQLKAELEASKRERDAAISDMKRAQGCICNICKSHYRPDPAVRRYECKILGKFSEIFDNDDDGALLCGKFEWRGVHPENTEVQEDA